MRTPGHNNLPNIIGRFFPRRDERETYPFYCASMLLLLKPWRNIDTDLKSPMQTWESAFDDFMQDIPRKYRNMLSGIQYFHECETSAKDKRTKEDMESEIYESGDARDDEAGGSELEEDTVDVEEIFTEEGLAAMEAAATPWRELLHARLAVEIAKQARIFPKDTSQWDVGPVKVHNAGGDDLHRLLVWKSQMKKDIANQNVTCDIPNGSDTGTVTRLDITADFDASASLVVENADPNSEPALPPVEVSQLNTDQLRAYQIICWHLEQTLSGYSPPPLRMILYGEGGTGKSRVIQTVTETFLQKKVPYMLIKAAYTGIAASLINGKTTHFIGQISFRTTGTMSNETKTKLQEMWRHASYLVIDEYSMLSKSFLAQLSRNITIAVSRSGKQSDHSFGGINVILCGDLHQFPPVAKSIREALFHPVEPRDSIESKLGHVTYQEFQTVVILKEQYRGTDPIWMDFLHHLRIGDVKDHHLHMLDKQVIENPETSPVDYNSPPWSDAPLVTPRHAVRTEWNSKAIRKWCRESKERLYICRAEDTCRGKPLTQTERRAMTARMKNDKRKKTKNLPSVVEFAIGMKVMVTSNIETDLDLANGARGEIVDIVLHPNEPTIKDGPVVVLNHLPSFILVKLTRTRATKLAGLEEAVIPVEPMSIKYQISVRANNNKIMNRTVCRKQFPITAAYAFTDYRSQGQTIPYVLVDIGKPPTGGLTLFNLYVSLSRSSGRSTIRLLRKFDHDIFKKPHSFHLLAEDDRLEQLNSRTKEIWEQIKNNTE
jgi:PIF1-like helicase